MVLAAGAGSGGRGRVKGTLPAEVLLAALYAAEAHEAVAELGGHKIVQDGVDGRVKVEHDPAEEEQVVVAGRAQRHHVLRGDDDDPEGEGPERQQADEEGQHHRTQHHHHLQQARVSEGPGATPSSPTPAATPHGGGCAVALYLLAVLDGARRGGLAVRLVTVVALLLVRRHDTRVHHEVSGDDAVQGHEQHQRHAEEDRDGAHEEGGLPEGVGRRHAHGYQRAVPVLLEAVLGHGQDRAATRSRAPTTHALHVIRWSLRAGHGMAGDPPRKWLVVLQAAALRTNKSD